MMLDDVYGSDVDEMVLRQQDELLRDRVPPELEWDESEATLVVERMLGGSHRHSHDYHDYS